jgi:hypothetical protein
MVNLDKGRYCALASDLAGPHKNRGNYICWIYQHLHLNTISITDSLVTNAGNDKIFGSVSDGEPKLNTRDVEEKVYGIGDPNPDDLPDYPLSLCGDTNENIARRLAVHFCAFYDYVGVREFTQRDNTNEQEGSDICNIYNGKSRKRTITSSKKVSTITCEGYEGSPSDSASPERTHIGRRIVGAGRGDLPDTMVATVLITAADKSKWINNVHNANTPLVTKTMFNSGPILVQKNLSQIQTIFIMF